MAVANPILDCPASLPRCPAHPAPAQPDGGKGGTPWVGLHSKATQRANLSLAHQATYVLCKVPLGLGLGHLCAVQGTP